MMNHNIANGNWQELKGRVHAAWGKLTQDELETTKGDAMVIAGLIQKKYGIAQEEAHQKITALFAGPQSPGAAKK